MEKAREAYLMYIERKNRRTEGSEECPNWAEWCREYWGTLKSSWPGNSLSGHAWEVCSFTQPPSVPVLPHTMMPQLYSWDRHFRSYLFQFLLTGLLKLNIKKQPRDLKDSWKNPQDLCLAHYMALGWRVFGDVSFTHAWWLNHVLPIIFKVMQLSNYRTD